MFKSHNLCANISRLRREILFDKNFWTIIVYSGGKDYISEKCTKYLLIAISEHQFHLYFTYNSSSSSSSSSQGNANHSHHPKDRIHINTKNNSGLNRSDDNYICCTLDWIGYVQRDFFIKNRSNNISSALLKGPHKELGTWTFSLGHVFTLQICGQCPFLYLVLWPKW